MNFHIYNSHVSPTENFLPRMHELEINSYEGSLTHDTFKELFELYSVNFLFLLKECFYPLRISRPSS